MRWYGRLTRTGICHDQDGPEERQMLEQGIAVRQCKNYGHYFQQQARRQSDDPVFEANRRKYKRRFAWVKAGRISDTDFCAWNGQAREMKRRCDRDVITLEEFKGWLKES